MIIDKYEKEFEEMYDKIINEGRAPTEVFKEYIHRFEERGIGYLAVYRHLADFVKKKRVRESGLEDKSRNEGQKPKDNLQDEM